MNRLGGILCAWLIALGSAFAADLPRIVFVSGEFEYKSRQTLPPFIEQLRKSHPVETVYLERPEDPKMQTIPGLSALGKADLLVLYVRRMTLPVEELEQIKKYVESGRPLVALRTSSHAFQNWKEFDAEVLGGNYQNHHGNQLRTEVSVIPEKSKHPILRGVEGFISDGSLYKNSPLRPAAQPLMKGKVEGHPAEPVAWTHEYQGARVFYTSLGHPQDFQEPSFLRLLENAIFWALEGRSGEGKRGKR